jgi:hypothetical protein
MLRRISAFLAAGAAYAVSTGPADADPISIGSFIISAFLTSGLGALLPTVSAALIGKVVLGAAVVGSMLVQSAMMKVPSIQPEKFKSVFRGDNDTSEIRAIGRVRIGGLVAFGNTKGKNRYRLICHTRGPWTGTEEHYLGGREVVVDDDGSVSSPPWATIGGTNVTIKSKPGVGVDTAWPELVSEFLELWSEDHTLSGIHQSLVKYVSPGMDTPEASERHIKLFQGGEPPYEKVGRAEPVYDPRDGAQSPINEATWEWRDNAITGAAHILRSFPSISAGDLDYTSIAPEADKADVMVETLIGTAPRARAWGFWTSESARGEIMEQVLSSIGAEIVPTDDNRYTIRLVDDDPPAEITFYRQHLVEGDYASGPESVQRPNICRIKYYCPERNYDFADIDLTAAPWARVQDEIDRVGEQIETIELPFCPDASQAQRIGRRLFALRRADAGIMRLNYAGVAAWGLTVANLPFPDIGEDGATVWKKCAIGSPRINDEEGLVDLPFVVWPDLPPWDPETMEAPAPEEIPDLQYPSDLDTPDEPAEYAQVEYPDTTREIRIRFTGVAGGTIAEATRRNYTGGVPETWASMTELQPFGNWYAYAEADYDGDDADFRVRFFNNDADASYWSDTLEVRPVEIDNTAPDAPVLDQESNESGPFNSFRARAGEALNVAYIEIQWADSTSGPWTVQRTVKVRPFQSTSYLPIPEPGGFDWTRYVRARAFSSDGTGGPLSGFLSISGPSSGT